jgi:hypothetical protein
VRKQDLIKMLSELPDDAELVVNEHSDYAPICCIREISGVPMSGWVMRSHPTMSPENKSKEKTYYVLDT